MFIKAMGAVCNFQKSSLPLPWVTEVELDEAVESPREKGLVPGEAETRILIANPFF